MNTPTTLVATMGGQPQIVTFTLDLLIERGEQIDQVVIVYLASDMRCRDAYRQLAVEFTGDRYRGRVPCHLRSAPVRMQDHLLSDAVTPSETDAVWKTFYQLFTDLKNQGQRIHLSVSGGRRMMALLAFSVGMLLFDSADRIWHIHTPDHIVKQVYDGAMLHVPPNSGVVMIEVPLVPWGAYFPGVRTLLGRSPQEVRSAHLGWLDETERSRCRRVWQEITPRQQDALRALVCTTSRIQAADQLSIAITTLDSHKTEIIRACRLAWDTEVKLDIHFLRRKFEPFLAAMEAV